MVLAVRGVVQDNPYGDKLMITRRNALNTIAAAALAAGVAATAIPAKAAEDTIKVGVLHSLSGTMAISETTLKDSVLPVFEELNGMLFYPVQYEGEESSRNVFYTGAAPNQQAIPAVEYLMSEDGGGAKRFILLGTDYVYPRTTNKILRAFLHSKGISDADIMEEYTPFGHSDWQTIVASVKKFASAGTKTAVVSTINGDANVPFYKELANQGIKAEDIPVVAFSVGEEELAGLDTAPLVGHLAAWNYFMSVDATENDTFIKSWHAFIGDKKRVTNDPMEATYIGFKMWTQAVKQAGTTDVDAVRQAMYGQKVKNLTGGIAMMNTNHHLSKPVLIGEIQGDGQFDVVWQTDGEVVGDAWSDFIPESAALTADWTYPWICGNCKKPSFTN